MQGTGLLSVLLFLKILLSLWKQLLCSGQISRLALRGYRGSNLDGVEILFVFPFVPPAPSGEILTIMSGRKKKCWGKIVKLQVRTHVISSIKSFVPTFFRRLPLCQIHTSSIGSPSKSTPRSTPLESSQWNESGSTWSSYPQLWIKDVVYLATWLNKLGLVCRVIVMIQ